MNNTKKIYEHAGKSDDQQNINDILQAALISTLDVVTDNSPNVHIPRSSHVNNFRKYPRTILKDLLKYTNRHSHQHKIRQIVLFHLVHTYNR